MKRRIPAIVRADLLWWHILLPSFNGICFLDETAPKVIHIFSDASAAGMGAFFFVGPSSDWKEATNSLPIAQAFSTWVQTDILTEFNINAFELRAILLALEQWIFCWFYFYVFIYIDNFPSEAGLRTQTLKGDANAPGCKVQHYINPCMGSRLGEQTGRCNLSF